jgi:hypothetical protein
VPHEFDPLARGPGQLGGPGDSRFEPAAQDVAEQPYRAVQVADVMLDQVQPGRRARLGQLPRRRRGRRRRAGLLRDLDDDAVRVARVQEGLFPVRAGKVHPDGLDTERPDLGQRALDIADEEVEVVRARAPGGQEPVEEGGIRPPGGRQQLDLGTRGVLQLPPPEPGRVTAVGPGPTEHAAEQLPAAREVRRTDSKVIKNNSHETSRYGQEHSGRRPASLGILGRWDGKAGWYEGRLTGAVKAGLRGSG